MNNLKKKITNHNTKVAKAAVGEEDYNVDDQAAVEEDWAPCSYQGGPQNCPLDGNCQIEGENVVYVCQVTRDDNGEVRRYCGSTQWFKPGSISTMGMRDTGRIGTKQKREATKKKFFHCIASRPRVK